MTFQNTGKERDETLDFIRECQRHWNVPITWLEFDGVYGKGLSWKAVSYETASRKGEPFDLMLEYYADYRREEKRRTTHSAKSGQPYVHGPDEDQSQHMVHA